MIKLGSATESGAVVGAVVLAAGESSRLGSFKPLLPWPEETSDVTLVEYQVQQLHAAALSPVIVVTGNRADEVGARAQNRGALVAINPAYANGKAGSVRCGVAVAPEDAPVLIVGVDQPRPAWIYRRVVAAIQEGAALVIPVYHGRGGHPPAFAPALRSALLTVREETFGLRDVVRQYAPRVVRLTIESPLVLVNLNTPEDLVAARSLFAPEGS